MLPVLQTQPPSSHAPAGHRGHPVLALGFRPFYLLAAAFAVVAIGLWAAIYLGWWPHAGAQPATGGMLWHAHEMVFGFAAAVVVGFLFTAGKNWTGLQTPQGGLLAGVAAMWLAARVLMWTGPLLAASVLDLAFLLLCAASFLRVLVRAGSARNYGLAAALFLLWALNALFHVALASDNVPLALQCADGGIGLIAIFITVIGGRVIPMFTANTAPGARIRRSTLIERSVVVLTLAAMAASTLAPQDVMTGGVALLAALAQALRLAGWGSRHTLRQPLIAILHLAYGCLPLGLLLLAAAALGWGGERSIALHALTVGAIGCAIMGMITRTALGHTGRKLEAGAMEKAAYACIAMAALLRVFGPFLLPQFKPFWIAAAAALWMAAFLLYLVKYTPYLTRPRADGRDG
ncbi:NnrS family protein [Cupriavidus sp. UME77]|uniref:NnrS family protein n=1 Tax=Cupriavidus sp. UME77 TaxID=1862321 RepID=UPI001602A4F0|nr:NnrS family protein [Cupriavidus sp. UME77]MBB1634428.1 short-chain dehydrogenase [Cupriavidus sp. UME77]